MRLKSRGLGRKELVMDFREYAVAPEDDENGRAGPSPAP